MTLRLNGSTSGYTEIDAPAVAGNNTLVFPGGNGSADQVIGGNGSGTLSWVDRTRTTLATSVASTSGTAIDFTSIPNWVKRITVMFNGVSLSGTSNYLIQIGQSSGLITSGYTSVCCNNTGSVNIASTAGYLITVNNTATDLTFGHVILSLMGNDDWTQQGVLNNGNTIRLSAGWTSLTTALDRIRITTVNGTDTFDAGSINILYEG